MRVSRKDREGNMMKRVSRALLVFVALASFVVLVACEGDKKTTTPAAEATKPAAAATTAATTAAPAGGAAATAALKMEDIKFDKTALSGEAGKALEISLQNSGAILHDFTIDKIDGTADPKSADTKFAVQVKVDAGKSGKVTITPAKAGTYEFYCSQPGHKEAGMKGTLTVK